MEQKKETEPHPHVIRERGGSIKRLTENEYRQFVEQKEAEYERWYKSLSFRAKVRYKTERLICNFNKDFISFATLVFTLLTFIIVFAMYVR